MLNVLEKINEDHVIMGLLAILLVIAGTFYIDLGSILPEQDNGLYNIDSTEEWDESAGRLWTTEDTSLRYDRVSIGNYGVFSLSNYTSAANYRTMEINATGNPIQLKSVNAKGYVNEENDAALRLIIYDCSKNQIRGNSERLVESCYGENEVYSSGLLTESGDVSLNQNLSDITLDGYVHVGLEVMSNATEKPDNPTHWDSFRLTPQKSNSN